MSGANGDTRGYSVNDPDVHAAGSRGIDDSDYQPPAATTGEDDIGVRMLGEQEPPSFFQRHRNRILLAVWTLVITVAVIVIAVYAVRSKGEKASNHSPSGPSPGASPTRTPETPLPSPSMTPEPQPGEFSITGPYFVVLRNTETFDTPFTTRGSKVKNFTILQTSPSNPGQFGGAISLDSANVLRLSGTAQLAGDASDAVYTLSLQATPESTLAKPYTFTINVLVVPKNTGLAWHISDLHTAIDYQPHSSRASDCLISSPSEPNYPFGQPGCDSSMSLVASVFQQVKSVAATAGNPDFVALTGDYARHDNDDSLPMIRRMVETFNSILPNVMVSAAVGNNDVYPDYVLKEPQPGDDQPVLKAIGDAYGSWLDDMQRSTFDTGGFYLGHIPPQNASKTSSHRLIVLNTVWYSSKLSPAVGSADPANQLAWLRNQLDEARAAKSRAILLSHIPFGMVPYNNGAAWKDQFTTAFITILKEYNDVIASSWNGHLHEDDFRYVTGDNGTYSLILNAPSVSQSFGNNPSIRLVQFDRESLDVQGYTQLSTVTGVADQAFLKWEVEYNARKDFGIDFSNRPFEAFHARLNTDAQLMKRYAAQRKADPDRAAACDTDCEARLYCAATQFYSQPYNDCMNQYKSSH